MFDILEKESAIGGTWRDNAYPGAACDSPAFAYCYSFEQKTDWSRKWAPQSEILAYMEHCADKYGLRDHIRLDTEVTDATWDDDACLWRVRTRAGDELDAEVFISSVGQLSRPALPRVAGIESFRGTWFHSAQWPKDLDLAGKRVAVVGNAASAIQIVPEIAPRAEHLSVFQRSANWMFPKEDREYPAWEQRLYAASPTLAKLYRWWLWLGYELRYPVIRQHPWLTRLATDKALDYIHEAVENPALRDALTPDYPVGAKRLLLSDDYYATLQRDHVDLVTEPIESIGPRGPITRDGTRYDVDVIVYATGFHSTEFLAPMRIAGARGRPLADAWRDGAEAYLGMSVAGFPNFFMTYGPNTNLGHNSIIFMIECQTRYIIDCLRQMHARGLRAIDVRPDVQAAYNASLQEALAQTAWSQVDRSWYIDRGKITNNWSGSTVEYWWKTRRADLDAYEVRQ